MKITVFVLLCVILLITIKNNTSNTTIIKQNNPNKKIQSNKDKVHNNKPAREKILLEYEDGLQIIQVYDKNINSTKEVYRKPYKKRRTRNILFKKNTLSSPTFDSEKEYNNYHDRYKK